MAIRELEQGAVTMAAALRVAAAVRAEAAVRVEVAAAAPAELVESVASLDRQARAPEVKRAPGAKLVLVPGAKLVLVPGVRRALEPVGSQAPELVVRAAKPEAACRVLAPQLARCARTKRVAPGCKPARRTQLALQRSAPTGHVRRRAAIPIAATCSCRQGSSRTTWVGSVSSRPATPTASTERSHAAAVRCSRLGQLERRIGEAAALPVTRDLVQVAAHAALERRIERGRDHALLTANAARPRLPKRRRALHEQPAFAGRGAGTRFTRWASRTLRAGRRAASAARGTAATAAARRAAAPAATTRETAAVHRQVDTRGVPHAVAAHRVLLADALLNASVGATATRVRHATATWGSAAAAAPARGSGSRAATAALGPTTTCGAAAGRPAAATPASAIAAGRK